MADLDEISMLLGELKADVRAMTAWTDKHEERDQERFIELAKRIDHLGLPLTRLSQIERDLEASLPIIEGVKKLRWVGVGFVASVGLVSSGLTAIVSASWDHITALFK